VARIGRIVRFLSFACASCAILSGQIRIAGRIVDENGAPILGARIELRPASGAAMPAVSGIGGRFQVTLPSPGEYSLRAERQGFYVFEERTRQFDSSAELHIVLNHRQELSDKIEVAASASVIDPTAPTERKELDNTEIQSVPYPAPQDYRNALPMMDGIVQDNAGRAHFNGGAVRQANYTLDGFNVSDPVTGRIEARVNMESIQSMEVVSSRFSAENGRGSAGVLNLHTKMGGDQFRIGGTNFIPGLASDGGIRISQWTPRLEVSGPFAKGRAWFHNGADLFYSNDVVHGLPNGQNRTSGYTASDLSRFQVNLKPGNILTGSFLANFGDTHRSGLSFVNPVEATTNRGQTFYVSSLRDQWYSGGTLLDVGFADTRGIARDMPQGAGIFQITPFGNRGNFYTGFDRHFYRQEWLSNVFLPARRLAGSHQLKLGFDFERQAFHQTNTRHDYEVLRADNTIARYVTFEGNPFLALKNFEGSTYVQDSWMPREGLAIEAGARAEWNEIVRSVQLAPRLAVAWAPKFLHETKISAGWGRYFDAIPLDVISRSQDQVSLATFYPPGGPVAGPVATQFLVDDHALRAPMYGVASISVERKIPFALFLRSGYMHRSGDRGFAFAPSATPGLPDAIYVLRNSRRERYDAAEISVRRTFAGGFEWVAGYTRSAARSNAAVDFSLENPIFANQAPGPQPWDTPNRVHTWGWAPVPAHLLPARLRWAARSTTLSYLVEYRTGFPFGVVSEEGVLLGHPNSLRLPNYFNVNLALERQFHALHWLWAWRFGFNNLTNNGNPNVVNNVAGTPAFLTYGRGQARAFAVRLRFLGRK
jgi:hypothetical protein